MFAEHLFSVKHLRGHGATDTVESVRPPGEDDDMTASIALTRSDLPRSDRQAAAARQARRQLFWRRRLTVLAVVVAIVVIAAAVVLTTQGVQADDGSAPVTGEPVRHVVASGESLWSIAEQLAPGHDPRPVVRQLERSAGSASLQVGQVLIIPADLAG